MPFKSERQRRFMWAKHKRIARRWTKEEEMTKSMELVDIQKAYIGKGLPNALGAYKGRAAIVPPRYKFNAVTGPKVMSHRAGQQRAYHLAAQKRLAANSPAQAETHRMAASSAWTRGSQAKRGQY